MEDDLKKYTWLSPQGTEVLFPWDLEKYVFTPAEFMAFKRFMHGKTVMMVGHGSAYYPVDVLKFAKLQADLPTS